MTLNIIGNPLMEFIKYGPFSLDRSMSKSEFVEFHSRFPDLLMEREKNGKVTIMSPAKKGSGKRESLLQIIIGMWVLQTGMGEIYSPSTGIELPDSSIKSPDLAWVSGERLEDSQTDDEKFLNIVPDFVVELRSSTDRISKLKKKMQQTWMANGVKLAWLIDPYSETVWIYRVNQEVEEIKGFDGTVLIGEHLMPGMEFPLEKLKIK